MVSFNFDTVGTIRGARPAVRSNTGEVLARGIITFIKVESYNVS